MKSLNKEAAGEWCRLRNIAIDERGLPKNVEPESYKCRFEVPKFASKHAWFSRFLERTLRPWNNCLFWVTEWGVWESSENWHLYYLILNSYGDKTLINESPAHLFLDFESYDLISLVHVVLGMGFDFWLLTNDDYCRISVSHDEWLEISMREREQLGKVREELVSAGLTLIPI